LQVLVKLFGGTSAVQRPSGVKVWRPTLVSIPPIVAVYPWRLILNGREKIVQSVCDDYVVIDGYEERRHHTG